MALVLVTGAAGFIGSNLTKALLNRGDQVIGLDNFNAFYAPAMKRRNIAPLLSNPNFTLAETDILDASRVGRLLNERRPDAIVHLAAHGGVRPSMERPAEYIRNNIEGTTVLLEATRRRPETRFLFASSSSVYGGVNEVPFREDMDVDRPISPYAATKRAGEILAHTFHITYGLPVWCLRFFTCYGAAQRPDLAIRKFTTLIDEGREVPMYGDGGAYRDYLFIDDCIAGVTAAIDRCAGYEVINLGESRTVQLDELIALIAKELGKPAKIQRLPEQPGDVPRTFADVSKARALLDYHPTTPIEVGLKRFMAWYQEEKRAAQGRA